MKMDKYISFIERIKEAAELFRKIDKKETIRLVSHLDADGICASAILTKLFNNENRKYSLSIVQSLSDQVLDELSMESYKHIIFSDLGSGKVDSIAEKLKNRNVIILDHHNPGIKESYGNITHINPHLHGIDGNSEISGAGVSYIFAKSVNKNNECMSYLAIIGAIGDIQENNGFMRLNREMLDTAVRHKKITVTKGLRIFGMQTRPIHKALEYSTEPFIPGVSGSESGAIQFLNDININPRHEKGWKKLVNLSDTDMKKLVAGIVMRRVNEEKPEDIIGDIYLLNSEPSESPMKDAREFSTLLNACGRMDKASVGIGAALGDKKMKSMAIRVLAAYKREIINALNWFHQNKESGNVTRNKGYVIINAKANILSTIAGTLASILSKSKEFPDGTFILSLAQQVDDTTKISLRISGRNTEGMDLNEIINEVSSRVGSIEAGGHMNAAGCLIPTEKEKEFIDAAVEVLKKKSMEEVVVV